MSTLFIITYIDGAGDKVTQDKGHGHEYQVVTPGYDIGQQARRHDEDGEKPVVVVSVVEKAEEEGTEHESEGAAGEQ